MVVYVVCFADTQARCSRCGRRKLLQGGRVLILAMERRVNFDAQALRAVSTGYAQFHSQLCLNHDGHAECHASLGVCPPHASAHCSPLDDEAAKLEFRCSDPQACPRSFVGRRLAISPPQQRQVASPGDPAGASDGSGDVAGGSGLGGNNRGTASGEMGVLPQYFAYDRVAQLELWEIRLRHAKSG